MRVFAENYLNVLRGTFAGLNLVGIENEEEFYIKQVMDALIAFESSVASKEVMLKTKLVVDIGFGGGFPLLPLAYSFPNISFIGFESKQKKVLAVKTIASALHLKNVSVFHHRAEELFFDRECLITFKAVGSCYNMLQKINPTSKELHVLFYKGPQIFELEKDTLTKIKKWDLVERCFYELPQTDGRWVLRFQNLQQKDFSGLPLTKLVNLSSFL